MDTAHVLKKLRLAHPARPSQEMIGNILGITRITYGKKENGKLSLTADDALRLSNFYNVDVALFIDPNAAGIDKITADPNSIKTRTEPKDTFNPMNISDADLIRNLSALLVEKEKKITALEARIAQLEECKKKIKCVDCPARQNCQRAIIN